jgi:hypothetical protein
LTRTERGNRPKNLERNSGAVSSWPELRFLSPIADTQARVSERRKRREAERAARKAAEKQRKAEVRRDAEGRAHLFVIHRDARGRPARLSLSRPLFHDDWQNGVTVAAASTAYGMLGQAPTLEGSVALGRNAMSATSKLAEAALSSSPAGELACRPGCAHCCHQAVGVSPPEVFVIHDHLLATRTPAELEAFDQRLRSADERTRGMSLTERLSPELPCPFLEQGRCSIYEVRPLACRGKNSLDATACERTLFEPEARADFISGKLAVPCYREPIRAFHAVSAGVQLALEELLRLHAEPLELTAAMRVLRDDPESVPRRWLSGEDPFAQARGGDASDDPRLRELSGRR